MNNWQNHSTDILWKKIRALKTEQSTQTGSPTKPVGRGCKRGWKDNPGLGFSPLAAAFAFHVVARAVGSAASHIQGICTLQDGSHGSLGSLSASACTQRILPPTHNLAESHTSLLLNCQSTTQAINVLTFKFVLLHANKQSWKRHRLSSRSARG